MRAGAVRMAFTFVILSDESFEVGAILGFASWEHKARPPPQTMPASAAPRESWLRKDRRFIVVCAYVCDFETELVRGQSQVLLRLSIIRRP